MKSILLWDVTPRVLTFRRNLHFLQI